MINTEKFLENIPDYFSMDAGLMYTCHCQTFFSLSENPVSRSERTAIWQVQKLKCSQKSPQPLKINEIIRAQELLAKPCFSAFLLDIASGVAVFRTCCIVSGTPAFSPGLPLWGGWNEEGVCIQTFLYTGAESGASISLGSKAGRKNAFFDVWQRLVSVVASGRIRPKWLLFIYLSISIYPLCLFLPVCMSDCLIVCLSIVCLFVLRLYGLTLHANSNTFCPVCTNRNRISRISFGTEFAR